MECVTSQRMTRSGQYGRTQQARAMRTAMRATTPVGTAHPGELFGLPGPNGAGKTTTMRILCTVLRPTGGRALVAGYDVATQPSQVRQNIGFLSANTAIYDRMSAWELVQYFGRLYGLTE